MSWLSSEVPAGWLVWVTTTRSFPFQCAGCTLLLPHPRQENSFAFSCGLLKRERAMYGFEPHGPVTGVLAGLLTC